MIMIIKMKHHIDQKRGMPIAAMTGNILMSPANDEKVELVPDEFPSIQA